MRVDTVSAPIFDARLVGGGSARSPSARSKGARTGSCARAHRSVPATRRASALPPDPRRRPPRAGRSQLCATPGRHGVSRHLPTLHLRGTGSIRSAPLQRPPLVHRGARREHREPQRHPGSRCRCAPRRSCGPVPGELRPRSRGGRRAPGQRGRGRCGDDPAAAAQRLRRGHTLRVTRRSVRSCSACSDTRSSICTTLISDRSGSREHFVSTRYVHKLFAASGTGVSEWIRDRRLEGATAELRNRALRSPSWLSDGVPQPGEFQQGLPRRYGCAPSDVRRAGLSA